MRRKLLLFGLCLVLVSNVAPHVSAEEITEKSLSPYTVLPMRRALVMGIEKNLNLATTALNVPVRGEDVIVNEAAFDPIADALFFGQDQKILTASAFQGVPWARLNEFGGSAGLSKLFDFGLQSRLSFQSSRLSDNSQVEDLNPQYQDFLILDLTQALLRDFGSAVNTTQIRVAKNQVDQAAYGYLSQAQQIGQQIEAAYFGLASALDVFRYRIESRELAKTLLAGNREKFKRGVVSISEVQEAETAVAAREEEVLAALQRVETFSNNLKDLLEVGPGNPLYTETIMAESLPGIDQAFPELERALAVALEKRPDLFQQQLAVTNSDILLSFYRNQKLPRLDLEATLGVNGLSGGNRPVIPRVPGQGFSPSPLVGPYSDSLSRMAQGDGYQWYAGLRFTYPLGNRAAKARFQRSGIEKRQAIYVLKRLETSIETEVKNSLVTVKRSLQRVKVADRTVSLAKKTLDQEMYRLKEGLSDTFRILQYQLDLINAQISKVAALADFNIGLANLYRAMGTNLEKYRIETEINPEGVS